jgi:superfamily I DNA/RNA helicase
MSLKKIAKLPSKESSDCIVMTAHKSKGLEFDSVYIGDDFNLLYEHDKKFYITGSEMELNLTYVAITRAMKYVNCTNLRQFFNVLYDEIKNPFEVIY